MYNLELALEALDASLNDLFIDSGHQINHVALENSYMYERFSRENCAMEGIIDKIKNIFLKTSDRAKSTPANVDDLDKEKKDVTSKNMPNSITEYLRAIGRKIAADINPFSGSIPLTLSWICVTNLAELFSYYTKRNPKFTMPDFIDYALDNVKTENVFIFRYYDGEARSIKESSFTEQTSNPYFKEVLGFTFYDACRACMVMSLKKLLSKSTYDEYSKDGIPMAYIITCSFVYELNKRNETITFQGFNIDEDLMTGMGLSTGSIESRYLPDEMTKKRMASPVTKELISMKN